LLVQEAMVKEHLEGFAKEHGGRFLDGFFCSIHALGIAMRNKEVQVSPTMHYVSTDDAFGSYRFWSTMQSDSIPECVPKGDGKPADLNCRLLFGVMVDTLPRAYRLVESWFLRQGVTRKVSSNFHLSPLEDFSLCHALFMDTQRPSVRAVCLSDMLNRWHSTLLFILPVALSLVIRYVYYGQIERMFFAVLKVGDDGGADTSWQTNGRHVGGSWHSTCVLFIMTTGKGRNFGSRSI